MNNIQGSAKEQFLSCGLRARAARIGQNAGITQPRDYSLAVPCNSNTTKYYSLTAIPASLCAIVHHKLLPVVIIAISLIFPKSTIGL